MNRWSVAVILLAACGSKTESTPAAGASGSGSAAAAPDGPTIPPAFADFRGPIVTQGAVFLDKQRLLVRPPQLVTDRAPFADSIKRLNAKGDMTLGFTADASAQSVLGAMRAIIEAGHNEVSLATIVNGKPKVICYSKQFTPTMAPEDRVNLSVLIETDARIIGISRLQELDSLKPPFADFAAKLADQKKSSFFAEREDVELAVGPTIQGAELAEVLTSLCTSFHGIEPRDVSELSINKAAVPSSGSNGSAASGMSGQSGASTGSGDAYGGQRKSSTSTPPEVRIGPATCDPGLDRAIVRRYLKQHTNELSYCYEKQLQTKPTLGGTVTAKFAIGTDGKVATSTADGVDPEVSRCMADVIHAIEFPKPKNGRAMKVSCPVTFAPGHK